MDELLKASLEIMAERARRHAQRRERALRAGLYRDSREPEPVAKLVDVERWVEAWVTAYANVLVEELVAGEVGGAGLEERFRELHDFQLSKDDLAPEDAIALFRVTFDRVLARMAEVR